MWKMVSDLAVMLYWANNLFCFCLQMLFHFYACQFRVNHDTAAIFANDDFLTHTDVQLSLRRNLIKTTATSITLYVYDAQTVA